MATVVGLDVGTSAVRAAELSLGRGDPTMTRFGQVALPPGVVVAGQVMDPPAVAAALRRLWREVGFSTKRVVVGVANQRVVARTHELPTMSDADLRTALPFEVQELIPMPLGEAVLDHQVIERVTDDKGQERLRLLVVAAHRDMVRPLLAALEGAGLSARRIDLVPFALVRALHVDGFDLGDEDGEAMAEAVVGVGAGVTNVVVHEAGIPRFVRTLNTGGASVVDELAESLDVDADTAEELKRRADPGSDDPEARRAAELVDGSVGHLLDEIRGSLEFHLAQADSAPLERIVLTGGGSRVAGLADRLEALVGVPVVAGAPLAHVELGDTGIDPERLRASEDLLAVPIGLALSGRAHDVATRRITLLPREIDAARVVRRQLIGAGAGIAAFTALLLAVFLLRGGQLDEAKADADAEEDRTVALQAEIATLSEIEEVQADIAARTATVNAILEGDVAWTRLIQEVATTIPEDVWLTSFDGATGTELAPGSVSFAATGFDQTSTARWLLRVSELAALRDLWVPSSTKTPEETTPETVTFTSNATLTEAAESDRVARYAEVAP